MNRRALLYGVAALAGGSSMAHLLADGPASAGPGTVDEIGDRVQTLPRGQFPEFAGSPEIRRLYRYAVERGDELRYIPCFCGCYRFGHRSNRDCYVKALNRDGTVTYTSHAAT
jgi:hypothetical protein